MCYAWRESFTSGQRFWERARLAYNGVLALLAVGFFITRLPSSQALLTIDTGITLAFLAIFANGCYFAAYLVEFVIQATMPQRFVFPFRLTFLLIGTVFACFVAGFGLEVLLSYGAGD